MRGYTSRLIAASVGRHTVPPRPTPTRADFAAEVYDQVWRAKSTKQSMTALPGVLALDAAHAVEVGQRRLERLFGAGALGDLELVSSMVRPWADAEALVSALDAEAPADWQERQDRFEGRVIA